MLVGHYATALIAHQKSPRRALPYFLVASQLPDLLWLCFHYLGLEPTTPTNILVMTLDTMQVEMTYSHDLLPGLLWAIVVGLAGWFLYSDWKVGSVGSLLVAVHELVDYIGGYPHCVCGPSTPRVGTGLYYTSPYAAVTFEVVFTLGLLVWFFRHDAQAGLVRSRAAVATILGVFGGGLAFMYLIAETSLADRFSLGGIDFGFNSAAPAMVATYVGNALALAWALSRRQEESD